MITGVLCALAAHIVLGLFGAAFGFAADPADSRGVGIAARAVGARRAVRRVPHRRVRLLPDRPRRADEAASYLHGAMVWCIGLIAGALFISGTMATSAMSTGDRGERQPPRRDRAVRAARRRRPARAGAGGGRAEGRGGGGRRGRARRAARARRRLPRRGGCPARVHRPGLGARHGEGRGFLDRMHLGREHGRRRESDYERGYREGMAARRSASSGIGVEQHDAQPGPRPRGGFAAAGRGPEGPPLSGRRGAGDRGRDGALPRSRPPFLRAQGVEVAPDLGYIAGAMLDLSLPAGLRDLLPDHSAHLAELSARLQEVFSGFGYRRVFLPTLERLDVVERGLSPRALAGVLKFVEPGSGEVVAIRPGHHAPDRAPLRGAPGRAALRRRGSATTARSSARARRAPAARARSTRRASSCSGPAARRRTPRRSSSSRARSSSVGLDHAVVEVGHARFAQAVVDAARLPEARARRRDRGARPEGRGGARGARPRRAAATGGARGAAGAREPLRRGRARARAGGRAGGAGRRVGARRGRGGAAPRAAPRARRRRGGPRRDPQPRLLHRHHVRRVRARRRRGGRRGRPLRRAPRAVRPPRARHRLRGGPRVRDPGARARGRARRRGAGRAGRRRGAPPGAAASARRGRRRRRSSARPARRDAAAVAVAAPPCYRPPVSPGRSACRTWSSSERSGATRARASSSTSSRSTPTWWSGSRAATTPATRSSWAARRPSCTSSRRASSTPGSRA